MTKTMIKKSLRAYISRSLFENAVLLAGDAVGFAHFQTLEQDVKRRLVVIIVLADFGGGNHLHDHPHMLRHTRAMHLYQDGVPLAMVSEFLGHAQIETTKIYAHADTEMKRKAIQQAANKLNDTIPDALWNTDDEEMMLKLRGKQQYK